MQKFTGNSMSLQQMAAWSLYIAANVIRRDTVAKIMPSLHYKVDPKTLGEIKRRRQVPDGGIEVATEVLVQKTDGEQ